MKYISAFNEGDNIKGIYLCKQKNSAITKNGKAYENMTIADRTGTLSAKIWEPNSMGIGDFDANDFIEIRGRVSMYNGALQISIDRAFKADEGTYDPADYVPVSPKDPSEMWKKVQEYISSIKKPYFKALLTEILINDEKISGEFRKHSAAKTVHHGFVHGLMHHTVMVCGICDFLAGQYKNLDRDLLMTAALLHDIGKTRELSDFPQNEYTDEGQLVGHIVIGTSIIYEKSAAIADFPEVKKNELIHCILSHHGEYEFGSPKLPALMEAIALSYADNIDAKIEILSELFETPQAAENNWLGFNKFVNSNIRKTT